MRVTFWETWQVILVIVLGFMAGVLTAVYYCATIDTSPFSTAKKFNITCRLGDRQVVSYSAADNVYIPKDAVRFTMNTQYNPEVYIYNNCIFEEAYRVDIVNNRPVVALNKRKLR